MHVQACTGGNGQTQYGFRLGLGEGALHKAAVNLELFERQVHQLHQAGKAGTKVVDRQHETHHGQAGQGFHGQVALHHELALGHFNDQVCGLQACVQHQGQQLLWHIQVERGIH